MRSTGESGKQEAQSLRPLPARRLPDACLPVSCPAWLQAETEEQYLRLKEVEVHAQLRRRGLLPAAHSHAQEAPQPESPPQQHEIPPVQ